MTEQFQKVKKIEIEILDEIDRICRKNDINYFLTYGTALGAARHGGFIPWDDDVDIGMLRKDYDKFIHIACKELKKDFFLENIYTEKECPYLFSKVRKNNTLYMEYCHRNLNIHHGIYVDIFPYDNVKPDIDKGFFSYRKQCSIWIKIFFLQTTTELYVHDDGSVIWKIKTMLKKIAHIIVSLIPRCYVIKRIQLLFARYKDDDSKYVWGGLETTKHKIIKHNVLFPLNKINFENGLYPAPGQINEYLTIAYGDWENLPPENERVGHRPYKIQI